jgi:hypothetical protein
MLACAVDNQVYKVAREQTREQTGYSEIRYLCVRAVNTEVMDLAADVCDWRKRRLSPDIDCPSHLNRDYRSHRMCLSCPNLTKHVRNSQKVVSQAQFYELA